MNPYDFVKAINTTKENLIVDAITEKEYNSFVINRSLSYFNDTILYANEMNRYHKLDNKLQFDFLLNTIRKQSRFSKWGKDSGSKELDVVMEYYGYSADKARKVIPLLSDAQIGELKLRIFKGGK
tara:strand:+ start:965 stop:1339 length:375 start_codon:yes stop_codon:yes gene_type:complete